MEEKGNSNLLSSKNTIQPNFNGSNTFGNYEKMFETGVVRDNEHRARSEGSTGIAFRFSLTRSMLYVL